MDIIIAIYVICHKAYINHYLYKPIHNISTSNISIPSLFDTHTLHTTNKAQSEKTMPPLTVVSLVSYTAATKLSRPG